MALLTPTSSPATTQPEIAKTEEAVVTDLDYGSVIEDTKQQSYQNLLTHIAGSSWVVDYFQQQKGSDEGLAAQDLSKSAVYQQYIRIQDLELKVSSSLSQSQDEETKEFEVTGSSTIYGPLVPNKGDMFIADIGDGRDGIFAVTSVERLTILKETAYNVSYTMVDYANEERLLDLKEKTIKETFFVRKLMEHGEDPLVVSEDYKTYLSFSDLRTRLLSTYLGLFFDKGTSTLLVPGQERKTFDPFLVKGIKSFTETKDHPILPHVKLYTTEIANYKPPITLWEVMMRFSSDLLPMANERLAVVDSTYFGVVPQFQGVYYSNVEDVVYPVDMDNTGLFSKDLVPAGRLPRDIYHQFNTTRLGQLYEVKSDANLEGIDGLPEIFSVTKDDFYIFSEAFYRRDRINMSQLETIVMDALDGQPVNQKVLARLAKNVNKYGKLEQFYYTPIILILIKMVTHGL